MSVVQGQKPCDGSNRDQLQDITFPDVSKIGHKVHIYTHPSFQPTPSILYYEMIGHTSATSGYEFAFFFGQRFSKEGITACNKIPLLNLYQNQNIQLLESMKGNLAIFPKRTRNVARSLIVADLNLCSFWVTALFPNHIPSLQGPTPQSAWLHYVHIYIHELG